MCDFRVGETLIFDGVARIVWGVEPISGVCPQCGGSQSLIALKPEAVEPKPEAGDA